MSEQRCPYCRSTDGCITTTSPVSPSPLFVKECKSCGRIVEEYRCTVQDTFVERAEDTPLCIVTPDFSNNEEYHIPPIEDDPFENIGFITTFSTWSMELAPLYTSTTSSFCGYLAELERVLLNPVNSTSGGEAATAATSTGSHSSMVDTLRAYFHILEVSSLLGLDRDISDHAVQLFRDCSSTACTRNRNVEALATAALVQASREAKEARTLQEISTAANVSQKEIHRYMKILTDALKLSQPINTNSISVYMPRFCSILELGKSTQDLATHIGEVVMNKSFCTRRNPISISAAAIYLSCQLEDKRKTQTEICKATALTEVTLRKVYKELLENIDDLLPANYSPVVPLEKAFPGSGSSSSRAPAPRGAGLVSSIQPPFATSSVNGMNSTISPQVNSGGEDLKTPSCLTAASVVERLGLFNSSNKTLSCMNKSTGICNDETSRSIVLPLSTNVAKAVPMSATASLAKIAFPDRAGQVYSEAAPLNSSTMHYQLKSFRDFFQDASPTSDVAAGALSSPSVPQGAGNNSSNSSRLHSAEIFVPVRDGPFTVPLHREGVADRELAKDKVDDSLTIDRGTEQERGTPESIATATSSWPSSQGLHKGLWDLNLAVLAPEERVFFPDLPTQDEVGGHGLPQENMGIIGLHGARQEVNPAIGENSEPLPLFGANYNKTVHPSFLQPSVHVFSSFPNSISTSGDDENTNIPSKIAAMVDNRPPSATYPSARPSGPSLC